MCHRTALVRSRDAVNKVIKGLEGDVTTGARIVANSLDTPRRWITINAGLERGGHHPRGRALAAVRNPVGRYNADCLQTFYARPQCWAEDCQAAHAFLSGPSNSPCHLLLALQ